MCQLELFEKLIEIKIVSSTSHITRCLEISGVQEFIAKTIREKHLWLYIDGIQINVEKITKNIICSSKEIILTKALVGG